MKTLKKIINIIFGIFIFVIILYTTIFSIKKFIFKEDIPSIFGIKNFIVISGSMEPAIEVGDIVFIQKTDDIRENDIIAFKYKNSVITHRVKEVVDNNGNKAYLTKGDANSQVDDEMVLKKDVYGKSVFVLKKVGNIVLFFRTPVGLMAITILFLISIAISTINFKKKVDKDDEYEKKRLEQLIKDYEEFERSILAEENEIYINFEDSENNEKDDNKIENDVKKQNTKSNNENKKNKKRKKR